MSQQNPNPYAAPNAPSDLATPDAFAPPRWWIVGALAFAFGIAAGFVLIEEAIRDFQRFGALGTIPILLFLRATREGAGTPAAIAVVLLAVTALHRAARDVPGQWRRLARWPFIATIGATLPSYGGMLVGAVAASSFHGISPSRYVDAAATMQPSDPLVGLVVACAHGVLASLVLNIGRRSWSSTRWPLAAKWFVAFLALQLARGAIGAMLSIAD